MVCFLIWFAWVRRSWYSGSTSGSDGGGAVIHQPAAGGVDGQLEPGIVECLLDGF